MPSSFFLPPDADLALSIERAKEGRDLLAIAAAKAEKEAWDNAAAGITDPRVSFEEAELLIDFARSLPARRSF